MGSGVFRVPKFQSSGLRVWGGFCGAWWLGVSGTLGPVWGLYWLKGFIGSGLWILKTRKVAMQFSLNLTQPCAQLSPDKAHTTLPDRPGP